jgi:hypothetical protein
MIGTRRSAAHRFGQLAIAGVALATGVALADQATFKSPQLAMRALVDAAARDDTARMTEIFGPDGDAIVSSGDPVEDANDRRRFVHVARSYMTFAPVRDGAVVAIIGEDRWPFSVPIMKDGEVWRFDTAAGKDELLNRRIGRNELTAIDVSRAYVDAQIEYGKVDRTGAGVRTYAQHILSSPGTHDGLYWEATGKDESPLGPKVAEAAAENYTFKPGEPTPYHGYYFRILTAQGAKAPGGEKNYIKDGKMTGGFALVAYPSDYGASGIMTFLVNRDGVVFQKNLGEKTAEIAKALTAYDPDDTWEPAK